MTNRLFNLPSNILSTIYEMDSTYRGKIKEEINTEIFKKSFDIFRKKFIQKDMFRYEPQILADKFDVLLQFLFNKHMSGYENGEYEKPWFPDEIHIFIYSSYDDKRTFFDIDLSQTTGFEGWIYTITQYNEMLENEKKYSKIMREKIIERIKKNTVFDKYVIVFTDDEEYGDEYEDQDEDDEDQDE